MVFYLPTFGVRWVTLKRVIELYLFGEECLFEIVVVSFKIAVLFALCQLFGERETITHSMRLRC